MASVYVRREDLYRGDLPPVCVVTGRSADGTVPIRFNSLPDWTWLLLLFGVFPFLIASWFATERVEGEVPIVRTVVERFHRRRRSSYGLAAPGVALFGVAWLAQAVWVAWIALLTLVAAIAVGVVASRSFIDGRPDRTGVWVEMTRVHPAFVDALVARGQAAETVGR